MSSLLNDDINGSKDTSDEVINTSVLRTYLLFYLVSFQNDKCRLTIPIDKIRTYLVEKYPDKERFIIDGLDALVASCYSDPNYKEHLKVFDSIMELEQADRMFEKMYE